MLKTSAAMELALRFLGASSTRESTLERLFSVSVMIATECGELRQQRACVSWSAVELGSQDLDRRVK